MQTMVELIASAANAALLQIADQKRKRLEHDRVLVCFFEHPTTDLRSEILTTSISSRAEWCRQGWYAQRDSSLAPNLTHRGLLPHEGRNCLSVAARQQAVTLILDESGSASAFEWRRKRYEGSQRYVCAMLRPR